MLTHLDFCLRNELRVALQSATIYIEYGEPRKEDYKLLGIYIRKFVNNKIRSVDMHINAFKKIVELDLKDGDIVKVTVSEEESTISGNIFAIFKQGTTIGILPIAYNLTHLMLVLTNDELKHINEILKENENKFYKGN